VVGRGGAPRLSSPGQALGRPWAALGSPGQPWRPAGLLSAAFPARLSPCWNAGITAHLSPLPPKQSATPTRPSTRRQWRCLVGWCAACPGCATGSSPTTGSSSRCWPRSSSTQVGGAAGGRLRAPQDRPNGRVRRCRRARGASRPPQRLLPPGRPPATPPARAKLRHRQPALLPPLPLLRPSTGRPRPVRPCPALPQAAPPWPRCASAATTSGRSLSSTCPTCWWAWCWTWRWSPSWRPSPSSGASPRRPLPQVGAGAPGRGGGTPRAPYALPLGAASRSHSRPHLLGPRR
jgi:hypothetical protein